MPDRDHWMKTVVARSGLGDPDTLPVTSGMSLDEIWLATCAATRLSESELADHVARAFQVERASLDDAEATVLKLLPESVARRYGVFPVQDRNRRILVATADPAQPGLDEAVGFASGRTPVLSVAPPAELRSAIDAAYSPERAVAALLEGVEGDLESMVQVVEEARLEELAPQEVAAAPVVKLTNMILHEAVDRGASDIHFQPSPGGGMIRYRVDGVMRTGMRFPLPVLSRVISRIKVLGSLDITDRLRPQDGQTRVAIGGRAYDLRISTVPTRHTEKCVVRVLDAATAGRLEDTSIHPREVERLRRLLRNREGIVIVTGPTGSGKTTTLYGALREIATPEINVMTVEDPVEYEIPGLTQIEVKPDQGVTFAGSLRAILRQDPDVVFVGEIRDSETARIAAQAALTGHLVLTTLHANDAVGVVRRLEELGLRRATMVEVLRGALAQRLVRRLCPHCSEAVGDELTEEEERLAEEYGVRPPRRPRGCDRCRGTGYQGRLPVVELLTRTDALVELILDESSHGRVAAQAVRDGMVDLRESGLERVRNGQTSLEEVERVLGELGPAGEPAAGETRSEGATTPPPPPGAAEGPGGGEEEPDPEGEAAASPEEAGETPTILLVDDDPVVRAVGSALVRAAGYRAVEMEDGAEALAWLEEGGACSLVVLDLHMPGLDGAEVLRRARSGMATAGLPVIVVTSDEREASEVALLEAGADDYLRKPVDPRLFVTRIRAALRRAGDHPSAADGPVLHDGAGDPGRTGAREEADRHREDPPPPLRLLRA